MMDASQPNTYLPISSQSTCLLCGSTINATSQSQYNSDIRLLWCQQYTGCWALGNRWLVYETSRRHLNSEVETMRFFAIHSTIPVPNILMDWDGNDGRHFTIISQQPLAAESLTVLADSWSMYSPMQKDDIARGVANLIAQLRRFEADAIGTPLSSPVDLRKLFGHDKLYPSGTLRSGVDVWDEMRQQIPSSSGETQALLNLLMPSSKPFILTHGNLSPDQILMKGREVFAFKRMGHCAYAPCWWEYVSLGDGEFADMVRSHMPSHEGARIFWNLYIDCARSEGATALPAPEQGNVTEL